MGFSIQGKYCFENKTYREGIIKTDNFVQTLETCRVTGEGANKLDGRRKGTKIEKIRLRRHYVFISFFRNFSQYGHEQNDPDWSRTQYELVRVNV